MNWPPDIADDLPAPRDDEPASLRQDIADELADHLQSSFNRELYFTPETTSAKQNVLNRFGDPRRVARELWFDAMKEKIMSQRLNLVLSSLMTVACLAALGLMALMLRDSREVNAAILEKLAALTVPAAVPQPAPHKEESLKSLDWVRPKFKLVVGEKEGPPAVGFKVQMRGDSKTPVLGEIEKNGHFLTGVVEETTGADGLADLGLFRFGSYQLTVTSPWGETTDRQIGLRPGQEPVREIVCPAAVPKLVDATFDVDWPDDLQAERLWLICGINYPANRRVGGVIWSTTKSPFFSVIISNIGGVIHNDALIVNAEGMVSTCAVQKGTTDQSRQDAKTGFIDERVIFQPPLRFKEKLQLPELTFEIASLNVVKSDNEIGSHVYTVLAQYPRSSMRGGGGKSFRVQYKGQPTGSRPSDGQTFEPRPGQANRWTIKLPDDMLDRVRSRLQIEPDPTDDGKATPVTK